MTVSDSVVTALAARLTSGSRVVVTDGASQSPRLLAALDAAALRVGGIDCVLGWSVPRLVPFASGKVSARTFMAGFGAADEVRCGHVTYVPMRLSSAAAMLAGAWRPDLVLASLRRGPRGLTLGSDGGWADAAVRSGAPIVAEVNHAIPDCFAESAPAVAADVVLEGAFALGEVPAARASGELLDLGKNVAAMIPDGAYLQFGPGHVGAAVAAAVTRPVHVWSGIVTDAVVDLADRGLLLGNPRAAYVVGSQRLYAWAEGRAMVDSLELTHDPRALSEVGLVAVNTAIEIDVLGNIGVEYAGDLPVGAAGGWPDFAGAASRSRTGVSIVALPTRHRGRSALVEQVRRPVAGRYDVDVVVTEAGHVDLRGLSDQERGAALTDLWNYAGAGDEGRIGNVVERKPVSGQ